MIPLIRSTLTSLVFVAVWLAGTAYAQSAQRAIKVHIPFEFNVGDKTFPAGDYSVTEPLQDFLALRNARGQTIASTFTHPVESSTAPEKPTLRFYFSGSQHTLAEVWQPEDGAIGRQLPATKSRVAVAKQPTVDTEAITGGTTP
jgi:hypothetical protein